MIGLLSLFVFAIPEKFDGSHTAIYSQLPEVEMADAAIKERSDFSTFLENFGDLVRKHCLEDAVGLRLVHKHFSLEEKTDGQQSVMSERFDVISGLPSLVTEAQEVTRVLREAYPASWLFFESEEQGVPFEFSNDPAVKETRERIDASPGFFAEARQLIVNGQYAHLLSLAILERRAITLNDDQQVFIEKSYVGMGSLVQLVDQTEIQPEDIQTSWVFASASAKGPKKVACRTHCSKSQSGHLRIHIS